MSSWREFRKKALQMAINDGYFSSTKDPLIRQYDLEQNGTWRLNAHQLTWFKVGCCYE